MAYRVLPEDFPCQTDLVFENQLNVFHSHKEGLPPDFALGLTFSLNSSFVGVLFRRINGHTQANATDVCPPYPSAASPEALDRWAARQEELTQGNMEQHLKAASGCAPTDRQEQALASPETLRLPRAQRNTRSALCLLSLCGMTESKQWSHGESPRMGITPIMDWAKNIMQLTTR